MRISDWSSDVCSSDLLGALPLDRILTRNPDEVVSNVMARERDVLNASLSDERVAQQFQDADLVSAAVVDDKNLLVGRITIDDVVDVIRRDAEHKLMSLAGLNPDDDIFAKSEERRVGNKCV